MTSSQSSRAALWLLQVISNSVACWTTFWQSGSRWVSHRARVWSPTAWALRRCTRFCKHQVIPARQLIFEVLGSVCRSARSFRPCFPNLFLARPRASPTRVPAPFRANQDRFSIHDAYVCTMLSPLFRPSTCVSASARLESWTVWSAGGHEYRAEAAESLFWSVSLGRDRYEAARGRP
jgi:hypothetical protein